MDIGSMPMEPRDTDELPVWFNIFDPMVDPLVLFGSCLSGFMTFLVLVTFAVYHQEQRTFRHALVFNLTLAEFINSVNGAISGTYYVITKELTPGALCSINGWLGQVSVQASDFSMFAIAVITLLTITEKVYMPAISRTKKILLCISIWIIPLATGSIAVAMGVMMPSGANWCWISASRTDLRYALTHAWRFAVIVAIICIYGYVYYHTSRRFKSLAVVPSQSTGGHNSMAMHSRHASIQKTTTTTPYAMATQPPPPPLPPPTPADPDPTADHSQLRNLHGRSWLRLSNCPEAPLPPDSALAKETISSLNRTATAATDDWEEASSRRNNNNNNRPLTRTGTGAEKKNKSSEAQKQKRVEREVKRMLLMNAYPILYVLLWIPGMVNRLLQAAGHPLSSRVLDALQAAPVFIGFANAVTYGFNQHLRRRIAGDFYYWRARRGWSRMKS